MAPTVFGAKQVTALDEVYVHVECIVMCSCEIDCLISCVSLMGLQATAIHRPGVDMAALVNMLGGSDYSQRRQKERDALSAKSEAALAAAREKQNMLNMIFLK